MARGFSEQGTYELLTPYLADGERLHAYASGMRWPSWFWYVFFPLGAAFLTRYYAVGVKESGLILVELSWLGQANQTFIIPWADIHEVSFKKGLFRHSLRFTLTGGERWTLSFQFLALFRKNRENAVQLASYVAHWSQLSQAWAE